VFRCFVVLFNLYAYYRVVFCVRVSVESFDGNRARTSRVLIFCTISYVKTKIPSHHDKGSTPPEMGISFNFCSIITLKNIDFEDVNFFLRKKTPVTSDW
jgi:hypothetical protein